MPAIDFAALLAEERAKAREQKQAPLKVAASTDAASTSSPPATSGGARAARRHEAHVISPGDPGLWPPFELATPATPVPARHALGPNADVFYIPEYFTEDEERQLLGQVHCTPAQKSWVPLKSRRLQLWQAAPGPGLPPWLDTLIDRFVAQGLFDPAGRPDHCLLNEYAADQGILPHTDGPRFHPRVVTVSLGSPALMSFRRAVATDEIGPETAAAAPVMSLVLRPRSLVLFFGEAYRMLHAIHPGPSNKVPSPFGEAPAAPGDPSSTTGADAAAAAAVYGPCANLEAAAAAPGETIARGPRVSLTFRKEVLD